MIRNIPIYCTAGYGNATKSYNEYRDEGTEEQFTIRLKVRSLGLTLLQPVGSYSNEATTNADESSPFSSGGPSLSEIVLGAAFGAAVAAAIKVTAAGNVSSPAGAISGAPSSSSPSFGTPIPYYFDFVPPEPIFVGAGPSYRNRSCRDRSSCSPYFPRKQTGRNQRNQRGQEKIWGYAAFRIGMICRDR